MASSGVDADGCADVSRPGRASSTSASGSYTVHTGEKCSGAALGSGFYAEYVAVEADSVSLIPEGLELDQAGAMPIVALTAMAGLVEELRVETGETLLITSASGDVGHVAVQLATRLGARVLAVASGADEVAAAREFGAEVVVDRRTGDVAAAVREFAPTGLDAVLSLVGGKAQDIAIAALREGGRVAHPLGVEPASAPSVKLRPYDLTMDSPASTKLKMEKLNDLIVTGPFTVRIAAVFPLHRAAAAQRTLEGHRVGKIFLETVPEA